MISIIIPYWNRPNLLENSLDRFEKLYKNRASEFEVIIVDDYSPMPVPYLDKYSFPIQMTYLKKEQRIPMNPCVPINTGVSLAKGEIILLTNPEILHRTPILFKMEKRLAKLGPKGYIAAACWYVDLNIFICHNTKDEAKGRAPMPKGAGLHFCSMMYKDYFNAIEGFDPQYRLGQGYEDNDFLWKLYATGAKFKIADDLIVDHFNTKTTWPRGGLERNKTIFYNKWKEEIKNANR